MQQPQGTGQEDSTGTDVRRFLLCVVAGVVLFGYGVGFLVALTGTSQEALPWNARIALYFAGFSFALFVRGWGRLRDLQQGRAAATFQLLPARWERALARAQEWDTLVRWIIGCAAMFVGHYIGTTVFK